MKPTFEFGPSLLENQNQFQDPFFSRFQLNHASRPLQLNDQISKDYFFPTLYSGVTCAIGIFLCDYGQAVKQMPYASFKPVRMTKGRSLVALSCYEYKNVLGISSYNEIAMTIPMMRNPAVNVPVLPMLLGDSLFKNSFGYYVFGMPVTSKENQIRGNQIWGLPKITQEIEMKEEGNEWVTQAFEESGEAFFELRVPTEGTPTEFDVSAHLYSVLHQKVLKSRTHFKGTFAVNKFMKVLFQKGISPEQGALKIGQGPSAKILHELGIEAQPFQFRFARTMNSAFELPHES